MIIITSITSIGAFICALHIFGVIRVGTGVLAIVQGAVAIMRDNSLDDEIREKEIRHASLQLFGIFFSILIRGALAFLASILPIWLSSLMDFAEIREVISFLCRWDVIVLSTVMTIAGYVILNRSRRSSNTAFKVYYSSLERLLHRIAFSTPTIQFTAADIEKKIFGRVYEGAKAQQPIFITSLPRAGTTLILEVLHRFLSLATHTYRDMPFVMAPIMWSYLSKAFHKNAELRERAHGDGMQFGYDSPEAFEEVLWRAYWPEKYTANSIALWRVDDQKDDAQEFFVEHMKKIIALRRPDRLNDGRYISKNNGNIARLDLIKNMFAGAQILIPVRRPVEHAASMLLQHRNFIEWHKKEPFIRRYMADLGHYEFGDLHRPISFPGLEEQISDSDPLTIEYWLGYWIAAFEHVLMHRDLVTLISYEATCADGGRALTEICEKLKIREEGMVDKASLIFKAPSPMRGDKFKIDLKLRERAEELYEALINP